MSSRLVCSGGAKLQRRRVSPWCHPHAPGASLSVRSTPPCVGAEQLAGPKVLLAEWEAPCPQRPAWQKAAPLLGAPGILYPATCTTLTMIGASWVLRGPLSWQVVVWHVGRQGCSVCACWREGVGEGRGGVGPPSRHLHKRGPMCAAHPLPRTHPRLLSSNADQKLMLLRWVYLLGTLLLINPLRCGSVTRTSFPFVHCVARLQPSRPRQSLRLHPVLHLPGCRLCGSACRWR